MSGDTVSHVGIFDPALKTVVTLLSGSTLHPLPLPVSKYSIYRQCVAGRGCEVLSTVGDHIQQEFNTLYLTRFRTY